MNFPGSFLGLSDFSFGNPNVSLRTRLNELKYLPLKIGMNLGDEVMDENYFKRQENKVVLLFLANVFDFQSPFKLVPEEVIFEIVKIKRVIDEDTYINKIAARQFCELEVNPPLKQYEAKVKAKIEELKIKDAALKAKCEKDAEDRKASFKNLFS